jgi:putative transposase
LKIIFKPRGIARATRPLRIQYPGAFYHVMHRGNAGSDLFKTESARGKFLEYLMQAVQRCAIMMHTFCLMTNHYHLLIEIQPPNMSQGTQLIIPVFEKL